MRRHGCLITLLVFNATLGAAPSSRAAGSEWPIQVSGLLELAASSRGPGLELNYFNAGATMFDHYRGRLFLDGTVTKQIEAHVQLVLDEINTHPVYGAYAVFTPWETRDAHLLAGKMPWLIGTYGPRTYGDKKPLVGTPLMYQFHTTLRGDAIPANADQLLAVAGRGQYGVTYGGSTKYWRGMPVVYDFCWDTGVGIQGSQSPLEYSVAVMSGTPSMMMPAQDWNEGKSVMGRLGFQPVPMLRVGGSASYGPYMASALNPSLPSGKTANDYNQILYMADLAVETGRVSLISEGYHNTWQTPTVGDLDVWGYYAEGRIGLSNGAYAAARWESMRFSDLADSTGAVQPWDYDIDRLESGIGYRIARTATIKAVWQRNFVHDDGVIENHDLYAMSFVVSF
jgi:hypothetical protein